MHSGPEPDRVRVGSGRPKNFGVGSGSGWVGSIRVGFGLGGIGSGWVRVGCRLCSGLTCETVAILGSIYSAEQKSGTLIFNFKMLFCLSLLFFSLLVVQ